MSGTVLAFSLFPGDSVVLIALLGIIAGALTGRLAGGIRVAFFMCSLALALGLGHLLANLGLFATITELIGFRNPLWQLLIPRLAATLLLVLALVTLLESVHRKIFLYYKYKHKDGLDEGGFDTWEYLNDIWGLTLGVGAGVICTMVLLSWLHAPGYLLLQMRPTKLCERIDPWEQRLLRRVCADMHSLGLGTPAAKFGPASERYYTAADIVGYIYHNYARTSLYEQNRFHQRVFHYPGISPMLRQKEIQSLWTNSRFIKLWIDNTNFYQITGHTNMAPLLRAACLTSDGNGTASPEFTKHLAKLNLTDYLKFLREGHSDVYSTDNPNQADVIGTWQLAVRQTYEKFRQHYPQAREPRDKALWEFLRNTASWPYKMPDEKNPTIIRQYDWILTFTAENEVYSQGRFFPTRSLFFLQPIAKFEALPISRRPTLLATGKWNKPTNGQNKYIADLRLSTKPPTSVRVLITPANDYLIIRFPDKYNREQYVFRRYEF